MTDLRIRKVFNHHLLDDALRISVPQTLRALADAIEAGNPVVIDYAVGGSPCRLQIPYRDDVRQLVRVSIDLAASSGHLHDPTNQIEGPPECPTSAPAWDATTEHQARTASAPKPAANRPTSASSRRNADVSRPVRSAALPVAGTQANEGRS